MPRFREWLNPMGMAYELSQRLARASWHGLAMWYESAPWHRGDHAPTQESYATDDLPTWHGYVFTFHEDDDLERVADLWDLAFGALYRRYRRRGVMQVLLGSYDVDEDTYAPIRRKTALHRGMWRAHSTVLQIRNMAAQIAYDGEPWRERYREDYRVHGIEYYVQAPHYWRGWDLEGPVCQTEWRNGRRYG